MTNLIPTDPQLINDFVDVCNKILLSYHSHELNLNIDLLYQEILGACNEHFNKRDI